MKNVPLLRKLIDHESAICISLILPMHELSPERLKDQLVLKKAIEATKDLIHTNYGKHGKHTYSELIHALDSLVDSIDFTHTKEGLGIFLSENIHEVVLFPFPVHQKITCDSSFSKLELYYYLFTDFDYTLLSIQQETIRLFSGEGSVLTETMNDDFPMNYEETYEYAKPSKIRSHGSTVSKQFEREKGVLEEKRMVDFFKSADLKMDSYIKADQPLLVAGGKQELSAFLELTKHMTQIATTINKNLVFKDVFQLGKSTWAQLEVVTKKVEDLKVRNLSELWGQNMLVFGIDDVWKSAVTGNCSELMIDKTYHASAFISSDRKFLRTHKPTNASNYTIIDTPFEHIISQVLQKRGKVVFVNPGKLNEFNGIALKLRYTKTI